MHFVPHSGAGIKVKNSSYGSKSYIGYEINGYMQSAARLLYLLQINCILNVHDTSSYL